MHVLAESFGRQVCLCGPGFVTFLRKGDMVRTESEYCGCKCAFGVSGRKFIQESSSVFQRACIMLLLCFQHAVKEQDVFKLGFMGVTNHHSQV